jgi:ABC-type dipeptide/oligopeptide/nickel transport system permease component
MLRFLIRRTAFGVVVMWLVATIVFAMYFIAPHDVARTLAGRQASAATVAAIRHNLGLDRPILVQYGSFVWRALHGHLGARGRSSTGPRPASRCSSTRCRPSCSARSCCSCSSSAFT